MDKRLMEQEPSKWKHSNYVCIYCTHTYLFAHFVMLFCDGEQTIRLHVCFCLNCIKMKGSFVPVFLLFFPGL